MPECAGSSRPIRTRISFSQDFLFDRPGTGGVADPRPRCSGSWTTATLDTPFAGIVKLRLTAVVDAQHGGFATSSSPVSWGSIDMLFVTLTIPLPNMTRQVVLLVYDDELPPELARTELKTKLRGEWRLERRSARHTERVRRKD